MGDVAEADVVVVGAGPAGLAAAIACSKLGLMTIVVDTSRRASAEAARGRSAALFNKTIAFLQTLGVWPECMSRAEPLRALQFIDDTGRGLRAPDCVFRAEEIGEAAFGYNITNADLMAALKAEAARSNLRVIAPGPIAIFEVVGQKVRLGFEDGTELAAAVALAADGRMSALRTAAGFRAVSWQYDQIAIATSFSHERPHHGICIELHRSAGPFTLIPLPGQSSSLVWAERKGEAERLLRLDEHEFAREVEKTSRMALGRVFGVLERAPFPLSTLAVREYGRRRVALIGEAAHSVPPIGAQGLNLGFRDVEALVGLISAARNRQDDIGSDKLLRKYSLSRRGDIVSRTLGADILNRSLLSGFLPLQAARGLGLFALGTIGPLRRVFMRRGIAPAQPV